MGLGRFFKSLLGGKDVARTEGAWRTEYESHADSQARALYSQPVPKLLEDVAAGRFDPYHRVWYAVAERAEPIAALPVLFAALVEIPNEGYIDQFHCACAILHLLGTEPLINGVYPDDSTAVEYTTARNTCAEARRRMQDSIDALLKQAGV